MKRVIFCGVAWAAVVELGSPGSAGARGAPKPERLTVTLEYEVPNNCPGVEDFKAVVVKRLGRNPFVEQAPHRVSTLVSASDDTLSGRLVWRDRTGNATGEQTFPSKTNHCEQLIAAMGFALAVQIQLLDVEDGGELDTDTEVAHATDRAPTASPVSQASPPSPVPPVPSVPAEAPVSAPALNTKKKPPPQDHGNPLGVAIGAGGAIALGMSSKVVPAGRLFVDLRSTFAALEAGLELSVPVTTRRADGAGVSQSYLLSSLAGCGVLEAWSACAVLKVGAVHAVGQGVDEPNSANAALVQSGLRLGFAQRLSSRTSLGLRAEGLVNLTHWSVELDGHSVWDAPRFAFGSGLDFLVLLQ